MIWPRFLIDWINNRSKRWGDTPKIKYAYIDGPMRWEKIGGQEDKYLTSLGNRFIKDIDSEKIQTLYPDVGITTEWGPTHIQYQSRYGFLITQDPWCVHAWVRFRPQQKNPNGSGKPGTEFVIYRRIGEGRWDAGDSRTGKPHYEKPTLYLNFSTHYD